MSSKSPKVGISAGMSTKTLTKLITVFKGQLVFGQINYPGNPIVVSIVVKTNLEILFISCFKSNVYFFLCINEDKFENTLLESKFAALSSTNQARPLI